MASPNISFAQIGSGVRKPGVYTEFNTRVGAKNLPGNRQRTLLIGTRASGTLPANRVTDVFSEAEAAVLGGYGSIIHRMVAKALLANPYAVLSIVTLDDLPGAVAATWTVTFNNSPTSAGQWVLNLNDDSVAVNVSTTDTPTSVAMAFNGAVSARRELPFTAGSAAGVLTLTAKNKGTVPNASRVTCVGTVTNMTCSVANGVTGATDPDITTALASAYLGGHDQVVTPFQNTANMVALRNHLDAVGSPFEKRWALGYIGSNASLSTATSLSASMNHGWISNVWLRNTTTAPHEIAAAYAAVVAGSEDPNLPMNNVEVKGIAVPLIADRTSRTEEETALYNGVTPLAVGPGDRVQIVRAITTYTLNDAAVPDPTLLELGTVRALKYVAKVFVADRAIRYSRAKISARLLKSIRDSGIVLLKMLEDIEIIENVNDYLPQYLVERDLQDPNRINERIPTDIVSGLHVLAERFDLIV